jgi:hypothetical protein
LFQRSRDFFKHGLEHSPRLRFFYGFSDKADDWLGV